MKYIGIDLGGTGIKVGVVDEDGTILLKLSAPTGVERGHEAVIHDMAQLTLQAIEQSGVPMEEIDSIGIGIPGIYDIQRNIVPFCTNLFWHEVPLVQLMQKEIDKPVYVGNDASVAGLGETFAGSIRGVKDSVFVTLGTGVGGGVVLDGKLFTGHYGVGTEIGHMIIVAGGEMCTCGNTGCWERYASATALIRMGVEAMRSHPDCLIAKEAEGDESKVTGKLVIDCVRQGDKIAARAFDQYVYYLCVGLTTLVNAYDPEVIVLGGGIAGAGQILLDAVNEKLPGMIFCKKMPYAKIVLATLGNDAGIIGAALLGRAQ
ncbi:ROK family protein [Eubacteriales bacterium OttesenSCG-928-N13]|nr:ROK family protein [Eubacteriales bacterium OttesenSCG-928-N13]